MKSSAGKLRKTDLIDGLIGDWRRERPDLDVEAMAVVGRILHLGRRMEAAAAKALRPFGLNYTDLDVLATLRRTGRPYQLTPSDLLSSVLITSGAMTACIDRLEKASLIQRAASPDDRRVRLISLTSDGRELVDDAIVERFAEANSAISHLSPSDCELLAGLLRKLALGM